MNRIPDKIRVPLILAALAWAALCACSRQYVGAAAMAWVALVLILNLEP